MDKSADHMASFISKIEERHWGFVYVKSRTEKKIAHKLMSMGIPCYLPFLKNLKIHNRGKVLSELPMFPGYVFLCPGPLEVVAVKRQSEVVTMSLIEGAEEDTFIHELNTVRKFEILSDKRKVVVNPGLYPGQTVLVKTGALKNTEVVVIRRLDEVSIIVNLDILGRSCECRIAANELQKII